LTMESTNKEIIHRGNSIISIETLPDYPHPVVVKKPFKGHSSPQSVRSLENEYEMTLSLNGVKGVRRALEQHSIDEQPALILEYIDGQTLRDYIARKTLNLRSRLELAVDLARILGQIHQHNVIHLDLSSENILIGYDQQIVHFIDLSAASRIDGNVHQKIQPDQLLGTLQYISPEQTGRINRTVDERSDLYSLGVILYELMTGQLPFDSKNPAELIHRHIALTPVSPSELSPEIPEVISTIILKLLRKDADDRYQSAAGVQADLEKCLQLLGPDNTIEGFGLGETDFASRFRYPEKLYGRESELKVLGDAFKSACRETASMMFVSGYSGIGKTALIEEMRRPVSEKGGYFIKGKFDQYLRTTPYSGIAQAFDDFVSQIMIEPELDFQEWRDKLQSAVGKQGRVVTEVVPSLEELIGAQPNVPDLDGQEAENRFNYTFLNFLSSAATQEHPLVLFVDDLQWIDPASIRLLKVIQSDFNQPGLLVIGAYRDNEVDASHPLMEVVDNQEVKETGTRTLNLDNLPLHHLEALLSDTLKYPSGIKELGTSIYQKTGGNPFFLRRLLSSLNAEGRIRYDPEANRWMWNVEDIKKETLADNVADLLARTIMQLPEQTKTILNQAAFLGSTFDVPTLAMVSNFAEQEVIGSLSLSSIEQYVFKSGDTYQFAHDQVQRAAYALVDKEDRNRRHLEIGRLLLADTTEEELDERVFEIVSHFNLGADLLSDREEKYNVAKLNLSAGRKARLASAFSASIIYLKQAISLLGENLWQEHYHLTLDLHDELIGACYLNVQNRDVETLFGTILENAERDVDSGVAHKVMIMSRLAENELSDAISLAEGFLESLNVSFGQALDSGLSIDELYELPTMEDEEKLAALEVLMAITTPIIFAEPERLPSVIYTMLNIISQYGNSKASGFAYAWYSMILCLLQKYPEGNRFGQLASDLLEKYPQSGRAAQVLNMQCAWVRHWEHSVHDLIAPLQKYHQIGLQEGDVEWSLYCLLNYTLLIWGTGKPLEFYLSEVKPSIDLCEAMNQEVSQQMFLLFAQSAHNLTGGSTSTTQLEGKWFSEENMMSRLEGNPMLLTLYGLLKITLCYLFGDPGGAYRHIEEVLKNRHGLNPHYLYTKISFYGGLACIAGLAGEEESGRQERLEKLKLFEEELKLWAEVAPMNYQHQYHLLMAEKFRATDKPWKAIQFYEKAIQGAQENQFVHDGALANELFGRFWQIQGNDSIAGLYISEARVLYHQWGADAKVSHLEDCYPQYLQSLNLQRRVTDIPGTVPVTVTEPITPIQMDLDGIIEASQIINASQSLSSETDLDQLISKMMVLVMSNSGAQKAMLMLKQGEDWFVKVQSDIQAGDQTSLLNQPFDPDDREASFVPKTVFDLCRRSKEVLVVGDAQQDPRFAEDRMIQTQKIHSLACIPTLSQGELKAVLYLENRQVRDVFTQERLEILKHLSSQFGFSVENALLYDSLNLKVRELQQSEERYELAVAGSAAGLWDWDIPTNELYSSDRLKELLGYAPDELSFTLDEFWNRLHPDDYPSVRLAVDKHLEERVPFFKDYRLQTRSGEYRWFHARGQALWDETGEAIRMSGSLTDIDRRKRTEKELMQSEERFRSLMEQSPIAICLLNPEGQVIQVNSAWLRLWDVNEEEAARVLENYNLLTDKLIEDLGTMPLVEKAFAGENVVLPPMQYDANITTKEIGLEDIEAKVAWIQSHLYSVKDADGDVAYVVNTLMDLTDLKETEQEAQEQREALARVDRTTRMGQLAGSLAHELNQPLTGILSTAQAGEILVNKGQCDHEEMAEIMAEIAGDAKRAGKVIHNLRELYRDQKKEFSPVDINAVIDETVHLLNSEFVKQHVVLTTECATSIPMVDGNRVQLQQVLVNLIMNACQTMSSLARDDRRLHIATAHDANEVKAWVEDCGPGIDAEKIDRIFQPLATWKPGGTGMGLAMSNSIIEAHNGGVWAENRAEGGARVGFTLPVPKEDEQA